MDTALPMKGNEPWVQLPGVAVGEKCVAEFLDTSCVVLRGLLDPCPLPPLTHDFRELSIKPALPGIFKSSFRGTSEEGFLLVT